jgi:hypothetical protein
MNKPTPGPWHTAPDKSFYVFAHGSLSEQAGVTDGPFICSASSQANARLIAAAPDLLAALKALTLTARTFRNVPQEEQMWTSIDEDALRQAFDTIARAEGEAV